MEYELFYLVGQNSEDKLDEIRTEIGKIFSEEGAKFQEMEVINKRKLSYEIKHQQKGTYITRRFNLPTNDYWSGNDSENQGNDALQRITRKLNLYPDLMRFLIVKADELPELKQKETESPKKEITRNERKSKPFVKNDAKKETKKDEENIDKKLEEILNI